jgi:uracil-DNA glycosylase family 4
MPQAIDPELRRALVDRVRFYNELGIYDFYRREPRAGESNSVESIAVESNAVEEVRSTPPELREETPARKSAVAASKVAASKVPAGKEQSPLEVRILWPEYAAADPVAALKIIQDEIGPDCTRCKLGKQGRKQIVFGVGNPRAELMFVGEGPGADEDAQGEPFVGRAGQLLNNMIKAMGIRREDVYIANIVKCRPPGNRQPERDECDTCSPFLMRQISVVKPKVVVALGATAAKNLLAMNASMMELRGRFYDFMPAGAQSSDPSWQGTKLAVTYHPAFLLRDPRQKGEAWKDLQMVMKYLGLVPPKPTT